MFGVGVYIAKLGCDGFKSGRMMNILKELFKSDSLWDVIICEVAMTRFQLRVAMSQKS